MAYKPSKAQAYYNTRQQPRAAKTSHKEQLRGIVTAAYIISLNREPESSKGEAATMQIKVKYIEPAEYIPEHLRKLYKLGEYAEPKPEQQQGSAAAQAQQPEDSTKAKQ